MEGRGQGVAKAYREPGWRNVRDPPKESRGKRRLLPSPLQSPQQLLHPYAASRDHKIVLL